MKVSGQARLWDALYCNKRSGGSNRLPIENYATVYLTVSLYVVVDYALNIY